MTEIINEIETIRHGHKAGEHLSEQGREEARKQAIRYYEEVQKSPPGTVFFIVPSNVERAQETRDAIQEKINDLARDNDSITFVSVQDKEKIDSLQDEFNKRIIVLDIAPQTAIGFKNEYESGKAFYHYKTIYDGDEDAVGKTWAARRDELAGLRREIHDKHPNINDDEVDPTRFVTTPEEQAMRHIRFLRRFIEITQNHFPGHGFKMLTVGHNVDSDFTALALMGQDISVQSVNALGGHFRDFLEDAHYRQTPDGLQVDYRGQEVTKVKSFDDVLRSLSERVPDRKKEWRVLKDGDLVEVDANEGVVKVLEKN